MKSSDSPGDVDVADDVAAGQYDYRGRLSELPRPQFIHHKGEVRPGTVRMEEQDVRIGYTAVEVFYNGVMQFVIG